MDNQHEVHSIELHKMEMESSEEQSSDLRNSNTTTGLMDDFNGNNGALGNTNNNANMNESQAETLISRDEDQASLVKHYLALDAQAREEGYTSPLPTTDTLDNGFAKTPDDNANKHPDIDNQCNLMDSPNNQTERREDSITSRSGTVLDSEGNLTLMSQISDSSLPVASAEDLDRPESAMRTSPDDDAQPTGDEKLDEELRLIRSESKEIQEAWPEKAETLQEDIVSIGEATGASGLELMGVSMDLSSSNENIELFTRSRKSIDLTQSSVGHDVRLEEADENICQSVTSIIDSSRPGNEIDQQVVDVAYPAESGAPDASSSMDIDSGGADNYGDDHDVGGILSKHTDEDAVESHQLAGDVGKVVSVAGEEQMSISSNITLIETSTIKTSGGDTVILGDKVGNRDETEKSSVVVEEESETHDSVTTVSTCVDSNVKTTEKVTFAENVSIIHTELDDFSEQSPGSSLQEVSDRLEPPDSCQIDTSISEESTASIGSMQEIDKAADLEHDDIGRMRPHSSLDFKSEHMDSDSSEKSGDDDSERMICGMKRDSVTNTMRFIPVEDIVADLGSHLNESDAVLEIECDREDSFVDVKDKNDISPSLPTDNQPVSPAAPADPVLQSVTHSSVMVEEHGLGKFDNEMNTATLSDSQKTDPINSVDETDASEIDRSDVLEKNVSGRADGVIEQQLEHRETLISEQETAPSNTESSSSINVQCRLTNETHENSHEKAEIQMEESSSDSNKFVVDSNEVTSISDQTTVTFTEMESVQTTGTGQSITSPNIVTSDELVVPDKQCAPLIADSLIGVDQSYQPSPGDSDYFSPTETLEVRPEEAVTGKSQDEAGLMNGVESSVSAQPNDSVSVAPSEDKVDATLSDVPVGSHKLTDAIVAEAISDSMIHESVDASISLEKPVDIIEPVITPLISSPDNYVDVPTEEVVILQSDHGAEDSKTDKNSELENAAITKAVDVDELDADSRRLSNIIPIEDIIAEMGTNLDDHPVVEVKVSKNQEIVEIEKTDSNVNTTFVDSKSDEKSEVEKSSTRDDKKGSNEDEDIIADTDTENKNTIVKYDNAVQESRVDDTGDEVNGVQVITQSTTVERDIVEGKPDDESVVEQDGRPSEIIPVEDIVADIGADVADQTIVFVDIPDQKSHVGVDVLDSGEERTDLDTQNTANEESTLVERVDEIAAMDSIISGQAAEDKPDGEEQLVEQSEAVSVLEATAHTMTETDNDGNEKEFTTLTDKPDVQLEGPDDQEECGLVKQDHDISHVSEFESGLIAYDTDENALDKGLEIEHAVDTDENAGAIKDEENVTSSLPVPNVDEKDSETNTIVAAEIPEAQSIDHSVSEDDFLTRESRKSEDDEVRVVHLTEDSTPPDSGVVIEAESQILTEKNAEDTADRSVDGHETTILEPIVASKLDHDEASDNAMENTQTEQKTMDLEVREVDEDKIDKNDSPEQSDMNISSQDVVEADKRVPTDGGEAKDIDDVDVSMSHRISQIESDKQEFDQTAQRDIRDIDEDASLERTAHETSVSETVVEKSFETEMNVPEKDSVPDDKEENTDRKENENLTPLNSQEQSMNNQHIATTVETENSSHEDIDHSSVESAIDPEVQKDLEIEKTPQSETHDKVEMNKAETAASEIENVVDQENVPVGMLKADKVELDSVGEDGDKMMEQFDSPPIQETVQTVEKKTYELEPINVVTDVKDDEAKEIDQDDPEQVSGLPTDLTKEDDSLSNLTSQIEDHLKPESPGLEVFAEKEEKGVVEDIRSFSDDETELSDEPKETASGIPEQPSLVSPAIVKADVVSNLSSESDESLKHESVDNDDAYTKETNQVEDDTISMESMSCMIAAKKSENGDIAIAGETATLQSEDSSKLESVGRDVAAENDDKGVADDLESTRDDKTTGPSVEAKETVSELEDQVHAAVLHMKYDEVSVSNLTTEKENDVNQEVLDIEDECTKKEEQVLHDTAPTELTSSTVETNESDNDSVSANTLAKEALTSRSEEHSEENIFPVEDASGQEVSGIVDVAPASSISEPSDTVKDDENMVYLSSQNEDIAKAISPVWVDPTEDKVSENDDQPSPTKAMSTAVISDETDTSQVTANDYTSTNQDAYDISDIEVTGGTDEAKTVTTDVEKIVPESLTGEAQEINADDSFTMPLVDTLKDDNVGATTAVQDEQSSIVENLPNEPLLSIAEAMKTDTKEEETEIIASLREDSLKENRSTNDEVPDHTAADNMEDLPIRESNEQQSAEDSEKSLESHEQLEDQSFIPPGQTNIISKHSAEVEHGLSKETLEGMKDTRVENVYEESQPAEAEIEKQEDLAESEKVVCVESSMTESSVQDLAVGMEVTTKGLVEDTSTDEPDVVKEQKVSEATDLSSAETYTERTLASVVDVAETEVKHESSVVSAQESPVEILSPVDDQVNTTTSDEGIAPEDICSPVEEQMEAVAAPTAEALPIYDLPSPDDTPMSTSTPLDDKHVTGSEAQTSTTLTNGVCLARQTEEDTTEEGLVNGISRDSSAGAIYEPAEQANGVDLRTGKFNILPPISPTAVESVPKEKPKSFEKTGEKKMASQPKKKTLSPLEQKEITVKRKEEAKLVVKRKEDVKVEVKTKGEVKTDAKKKEHEVKSEIKRKEVHTKSEARKKELEIKHELVKKGVDSKTEVKKKESVVKTEVKKKEHEVKKREISADRTQTSPVKTARTRESRARKSEQTETRKVEQKIEVKRESSLSKSTKVTEKRAPSSEGRGAQQVPISEREPSSSSAERKTKRATSPVKRVETAEPRRDTIRADIARRYRDRSAPSRLGQTEPTRFNITTYTPLKVRKSATYCDRDIIESRAAGPQFITAYTPPLGRPIWSVKHRRRAPDPDEVPL